jgi:hypothetical protein
MSLEEEAYVRRGAYVARSRRGVCAPRGLCHSEKKRRMCAEGRMSPGEEETYVRQGACVAKRRRRLYAVQRMKLHREYDKLASRTQGLRREC